MFNLANRRYTGAKTKLLEKIDSVLSQSLLDKNHKENAITQLKSKRESNLEIESTFSHQTQSNTDSIQSKLNMQTYGDSNKKSPLHFNTQSQTYGDHHIKPCADSTQSNHRIFYDVFSGTGVVSEYFLQKGFFTHIIMNDFLYANYAIYQGFFTQDYDESKILSFKYKYQNLESMYPAMKAQDSKESMQSLYHETNRHNISTQDSICNLQTINTRDFTPKQNIANLKQNYYSKHFGGKFFSLRDAFLIGEIREDLDKSLESKIISKNEFYILLASLLYSTDKIANTVGHYDAYRKNVSLQDRFNFELIKPIKTNKKIEIYREDSNALTKTLKARFLRNKQTIECAFIDPPYNSRQYSRFYHLLETLSKNDKPKLYGEALKPTPQNTSKYCTTKAKESFKDLIENLAYYTKNIVVTYNNTTSANPRSNTRMDFEFIKNMLESFGKTQIFEFDYKAFNSGKTDFKKHQERIFLCQI